MNYATVLVFPFVAACAGGPMLTSGAVPAQGSSGMREFLVIGSSMSFEACRAGGGLIIRDVGSPMVACDPSVKRSPVAQTAIDTPVQETDMNAALEAQELLSGAGG